MLLALCFGDLLSSWQLRALKNIKDVLYTSTHIDGLYTAET